MELQRFVKKRENSSIFSSTNTKKFKRLDSQNEVEASSMHSKRSQSFYERKIKIDDRMIKHLIGANTVRNYDDIERETQYFNEILNGWSCFNKNDRNNKKLVIFA